MPINNDTLLKSLIFFPIVGCVVKYGVLDVVTTNLRAVSSIIMYSCIVLYLACIIGFLISKLNTAESTTSIKLGIVVLGLLTGVYIASIVLNSQYLAIINTGHVEMTSDAYWVIPELCFLFSYVSAYLSNTDTSTWLLLLFILIMPHSIVIFDNFVDVRTRPTDDAIENISGLADMDWKNQINHTPSGDPEMRCASATQICPGLAKNWSVRISLIDICRDKFPAWSNQSLDETTASIPVSRHPVSWLAGTGQLSSLSSSLKLGCCLFAFLHHCAKKYTSFLRVYFL